jgi:phage baseplate assembly protein W
MIAISIPFRIEGGTVVSTSDPDRIARQKIIDVLATRRFERPVDPRYGAGMYSLLFENVDNDPDDPVFADFKLDALRELRDRVSNVRVIDMRIDQLEDSTYQITVYYSLPMSSVQTLVFSILAPAALTEETPI